MFVHIHVYIIICIDVYVCIYIYTYIYICVCVCIMINQICMCILYMRVYIHIYIYIIMCMYIYIYIWLQIMYIIYIYICIHTCACAAHFFQTSAFQHFHIFHQDCGETPAEPPQSASQAPLAADSSRPPLRSSATSAERCWTLLNAAAESVEKDGEVAIKNKWGHQI